MFRLKWFLPVLGIALVVAVSVMAFLPPRVAVHGEGTLAITNTMVQEPLQLDIVSISDIPAYGVIEPSGCGEFKGRVKIRIDCFLKPESSYYDLYGGAYVPVIPEGGYPGEVDKETGEPLDWDKYNEWLDGLPTVWQDNPFHSHFVYFDTTVLDDQIKAQIAKVTEYFYAFHTYCWDNELTFLSQWVKVPKQVGTIRDVFIAGDSSPPNKSACEDKSVDVLTRLPDFDTRSFEETPETPPDLNIGEKGTITVGEEAVDGDAYLYLTRSGYEMHNVAMNDNAANASGTLDTVGFWMNAVPAGTIQRAAVFYLVSGTVYKCRDWEDLGQLPVGYASTVTGLSIDIITGDKLAMSSNPTQETVRIEVSNSGYSGKRYGSGNVSVDVEIDFSSVDSDAAFSLYGTGTESGGDPDISNDPSTWSVGTVATSTDYWSSGSEPSWPLDDGECHFTVTNNGDTCSMTVKGTNFTGGVGWTLAGSPGANTVTMKAGKSGDANEGAFIVLTTSEQSFISALAGSGTKKWELMMEAPTSHTDGVAKESVVTLTATLD